MAVVKMRGMLSFIPSFGNCIRNLIDAVLWQKVVTELTPENTLVRARWSEPRPV